MGRSLDKTDIEGREQRRKAFVQGGAQHPYAVEGATKVDTPKAQPAMKAEAVKKEFVPRKKEEDKFKKEQIRMHPNLSREIKDFADREGMDFSEAARKLIRDGLRFNSVMI